MIDPATGEPVADGEPGELVLTSLTKEALPIIRYRTRDLTRLLPGTARTMRRMEKITGRTDDMLIIRGVNVFPSQIEELILKETMLSPHYVLEVTRATTSTPSTWWWRPGRGWIRMTRRHGRRAQARLAHAVKSYIGVSVRVRVAEVGEIERSVGKAKRIIDMRPKD